MLSACGGGSSAGSPTPIVTSSEASSFSSSSLSSSSKAAAPTLTITNPEQKIKIGETGSINIATTNATSCSEPTLGVIPVNGSANVSPTKGGRVTYTISCMGDGGTVVKEALVVTPFSVQKISYLNKNNIDAAPVSFRDFNNWDSDLRRSGVLSDGESTSSANGLADFEQNGTFVFVFNTAVFSDNNGIKFGDPSYIPINGKIIFLRRTITGWVDITDKLLPGNKTGCVHPRKLLVADFNNDGKPDAFISCHGYDLAAHDSPYFGESAHILLSQEDGTYINSEVEGTERAYAHGASAADINNDGNVDIVLADFKYENFNRPVRFLMGHGDGTFTTDTSRIPLTRADYNSSAFWSTELIDVDSSGSPSLIIGGSEQNSTSSQDKVPTLIFKNINGYYAGVPTVIPPLDSIDGQENIVLDFISLKNQFYVLRAMATYAGGTTLQKIDLKILQSTVIYTHTGTYEVRDSENLIIGGNPSNWIDFITIRNGHIVSVDADFGLDLIP